MTIEKTLNGSELSAGIRVLSATQKVMNKQGEMIRLWR